MNSYQSKEDGKLDDKHYELTIPMSLTVLENVVFDEHTREVDYYEKLVTGVLFFCSILIGFFLHA